ncbi:MAG: hypothetical protein JKY48_08500 [Flavobacteriales bacterium]|nr:hypothetical protein [Flavobacteriales bacterium]
MFNASTQVRFAVLVEGNLLKKWQVDAIQDLIDSGTADCIQIIENKGEESYKSIPLSLGYRFIERFTRNSGPLEVIDISTLFPEAKRIAVQAEKKGSSNYFPKQAIDTLKPLQLDFILRFGFGILKGDILSLPKYGIWSFHHGNPKEYRGGPAGFWEIYEKNPVTGAILQGIGEKLDQGVLLKEGFYQTIDHSYRANLHHVLEESKTWPTAIVRQIISQGSLSTSPIQSKAKIYKTPSNWQAFLFLVQVFKNKIKFHFESLFMAEKWNIGIVNQNIKEVIEGELAPIQWIKKAPRHEYYADPFALSKDLITMEVFSYKTNKASIQQLHVGKENSPEPLISKRTHLSYPYTITNEQKTYILPENYRNNVLSLYELENGEITNEVGILQGSWIDPTLFQHEGRWWLFCTPKASPKEKLSIFYSDKVEGPYKPHEQNPVLTDIRSARPGGTPFVKDGALFRPTQNCSKTYGGSIIIKRIEQLTPSLFKESLAKEILPASNSKYNKGLHTLSAFGNKILVDGKRYSFDIYNFKAQLSAKLNRKSS